MAMQCDPDVCRLPGRGQRLSPGTPTTRRHHLLYPSKYSTKDTNWSCPHHRKLQICLCRCYRLMKQSKNQTKMFLGQVSHRDCLREATNKIDFFNFGRHLSARDPGLTNSDSEFRHAAGISSGFRNLKRAFSLQRCVVLRLRVQEPTEEWTKQHAATCA